MGRLLFNLLSVIGVVLVLLGAAMGVDAWRLGQYGLRAEATVIAVEPHTFKDADRNWVTRYAPVLEFTDQRGKKHLVQTDESSPDLGFKKGQRVPIVYSPWQPDRFVLADRTNLWPGAAVAVIIGLVFIPIGMWWKSRRSKPRSGDGV
jgi:hypothetical protein